MSLPVIDTHVQPDSSPLDAWQIGSSGPPSACLCCGSKFDEAEHKIMGPYLEMPYIYVCSWCHEKPYLFFPDKKMDKRFVTIPPGRHAYDRGQSILEATPTTAPAREEERV